MLRGSLTAVGAGVLLGIGASIAAARWLADLLFGVPPADVAILTSAGLVLLLTAVFANWLPARRASRVDPMRSLRVE